MALVFIAREGSMMVMLSVQFFDLGRKVKIGCVRIALQVKGFTFLCLRRLSCFDVLYD